MRVLIVEDERRLAQNIARSLRESAGYAVDVALDGEDGLYMAQTNPYDLVMLDLMLPKIDGLSLLKQLRASGAETPVLVLTARDKKESIVSLLNAGADDYVAKPFDLGELLARAKALIRRGKGHGNAVLKVGDIEINTSDLTVRRGQRARHADRDGVSRLGVSRPPTGCGSLEDRASRASLRFQLGAFQQRN